MELILNQFNTFLRSHLRSENTCSKFLFQLYNVLSSAKLQTFDFIMDKNKLFLKLLKSTGQRIDSCGTPILILYHDLKMNLC